MFCARKIAPQSPDSSKNVLCSPNCTTVSQLFSKCFVLAKLHHSLPTLLQMKGYRHRSLKKSIKESDKSGEMRLISMEEYLRLGIERTRNDKEINLKDLEKIKNKINDTIRYWVRILNAGASSGHTQRILRYKLSNVYFGAILRAQTESKSTGLWCNSASTKRKQVNRTLVQFCKHKTKAGQQDFVAILRARNIRK